jgi:segregation and condensation protein A
LYPLRPRFASRKDAMTAAFAPEYRVELPTFRGPLDLLLYLVKKHEVEILDIPIAVIVSSYVQYLEVLQLIDIEATGDFLVMASTLMEIKSRMMLPAAEVDEAADPSDEQKVDPRTELVKQLVAYRRYREAAEELERLAAKQTSRWPRGYHEKPAVLDPKQQPLQQVELWDLVSAFDRLLRATLSHQQQAIVIDDTPQHVHMANMLEQLQQGAGRVAFEDLFLPPHTKGRLIGLFLALLEHIKMGYIVAEQDVTFGRIYVCLVAIPATTLPTLATL